MAKIICPKCGAAAEGGPGFIGMSKPFCSRCGWNVESAAEMQREIFKTYRWGVPLLIAFLVVVHFSAKAEMMDMAVPLLFLLALTTSLFFIWRKLKRLDALANTVARTYSPVPFTESLDGAQSETILDNKFQRLLILSKPRRVGFKFVPGSTMVVFPIIFAIAGYFVVWSVQDSLRTGHVSADLIFSVILPLFLLAVALVTIRDTFKDRKLMTEGNATLATITSQYLGGNKSRTSKITYEFKNEAGKSIVGEGRDDSRTLYEDMKVLVFYKPDDPNVNIPICGSSCELKED